MNDFIDEYLAYTGKISGGWKTCEQMNLHFIRDQYGVKARCTQRIHEGAKSGLHK